MSAVGCVRLLPLLRCHHAALCAGLSSRTAGSVLRRPSVEHYSVVRLLQNWAHPPQLGAVSSQLRLQTLSRFSTSSFTRSKASQSTESKIGKNKEIEESAAAVKHRTGVGPDEPEDLTGEDPKKSLLQRFSAYTKNYWYVAIPLHLVTSALYFGAFYYLASIGFSPIPLLEKLGLFEEYLKSVKEWRFATLAVAAVFQKIAAPLRIFTTLACLRYLVKRTRLPTSAQFFALMKKKYAARKNT